MQKYTRFQPQDPLVPERFREARLARGLSIQDVANRIGVSKQSVSKYELGTASPSAEKINLLSEFLNVPVSFFYKVVPPASNRSTTFFRSLKNNSARAKEIMLTKSMWADEIITQFRSEINYPSVNLPQLPPKFENQESFTYDDLDTISKHVRSYWGLGSAPISNLVYTLESNGIIIVSINSGYNETDACSSIINKRPFIFMDTHKECAVRSRFNLAHELAHLLLHSRIQQADLEDKKLLDRIEKEANQFASCFLLPRETFLADIRSTSLESFLSLKKKWKVSIAAMVYRCKELEIFSENQSIYIQKQISTKRWRKNEPFDQEWSCEEPILLKKTLQMLIERGDFSKDQITDQYGFSTDAIKEICSLPKDFFGDSNKTILVDFSKKKIVK